MDELKYVLKCFLFASLLLMFSQTRVGGLTIESKVEIFLTESSTAHFMQMAAEGGAKALTEFFNSAKAFVSQKIGQNNLKQDPIEDDRI